MQFLIYILQKSAVHLQIKNIMRIPICKSRPICNPHISVVCLHACQPQARVWLPMLSFISTLWLQRATDHGAHCRLVSNHKTEWWFDTIRCHQLAEDDSDEGTREIKWTINEKKIIFQNDKQFLGKTKLTSSQNKPKESFNMCNH